MFLFFLARWALHVHCQCREAPCIDKEGVIVSSYEKMTFGEKSNKAVRVKVKEKCWDEWQIKKYTFEEVIIMHQTSTYEQELLNVQLFMVHLILFWLKHILYYFWQLKCNFNQIISLKMGILKTTTTKKSRRDEILENVVVQTL